MAQSALRALLLRRESIPGGSIVDPANWVQAGMSAAHATRLRSVLIVGCAISVGIAMYMGDPSGYLLADPALARLLRGMAVIKGVIAIAIVGAVWWRFGRAVSRPVAVSYALGCWVVAGSTTLVWQLTSIVMAAVLFHAAALSMLIVSWRDA